MAKEKAKTKTAPATGHPIKQVRRAGVPLVSIETADPADTVRSCINALNGGAESLAILQWDICNGLVGLSEIGRSSLAWYDKLAMQLPDILAALPANLPAKSLVFLLNIHRFIERDGVAQALWNLRDPFKANGSTLVCVGPALKLPPELQSDVIQIVEPVPSRKAVESIVENILKDAAGAGADVEGVDTPAVVSSLLGLQSAFDVEQTLSLSVSRTGVDVAGCWARKIKRMKETSGATVSIVNPTLEEYVGGSNLVREARALKAGRKPIGCVFYIDEVEKKFAGAGTDTSGVSTSLVGDFLSWTQDKDVRGLLTPGVSGAGKTWFGRCFAGDAGVPLVEMGQVKSQFVGASEAAQRALFAGVEAIAGDGLIVLVASCNWIQSLTPDVLSRFNLGQFFVDFPGTAEVEALARQYMRKYQLPEQPIPPMEGWVGREIENACFKAWQYNLPLAEVTGSICPTSISQRAKWDELRRACSGRFLSASEPGLYQYRERTTTIPQPSGRTLTLD